MDSILWQLDAYAFIQNNFYKSALDIKERAEDNNLIAIFQKMEIYW